MATIRLVPSTYYLSSTNLSISNATNMYNNTDNTTYATITNSRTSTTSYYLYIRGFNFDDIPSGATINSYTVKIKAYESGISTNTAMYLANGTTTLSDTATAPTTSTTTRTFSTSTAWNTIVGYGSNFGIRVNCGRSNRNTAGTMYVYGAEILVDYTLPYIVTSTITNGTITSANPMTVSSGGDAIITFTGDDGYVFKSMTVNGTSVTPTYTEEKTTSATMTYSTNYGIYNNNELSGAFDDDSSTCFWSNEVQAAGKYILISFDKSIDLSAFSTTTTGSSTDCIASGTSLQVSSDGGSSWNTIGTFDGSFSPSFNNLNQTNINAIRIYWNAGVDYWLYLDTISVTYTDNAGSGTSNYYYTYTISSITADQTVNIIFGLAEQWWIKLNGTWIKVTHIYQKSSGTWSELEDYEYDDSKKLIRRAV